MTTKTTHNIYIILNIKRIQKCVFSLFKMALICVGEPGSVVFGSLIDGLFEGKIVSPKGSYYVEKAHHYFPHTTHPNRTFHSVIYHEDHVEDPHAHLREGK